MGRRMWVGGYGLVDMGRLAWEVILVGRYGQVDEGRRMWVGGFG